MKSKEKQIILSIGRQSWWCRLYTKEASY